MHRAACRDESTTATATATTTTRTPAGVSKPRAASTSTSRKKTPPLTQWLQMQMPAAARQWLLTCEAPLQPSVVPACPLPWPCAPSICACYSQQAHVCKQGSPWRLLRPLPCLAYIITAHTYTHSYMYTHADTQQHTRPPSLDYRRLHDMRHARETPANQNARCTGIAGPLARN